MHVSSRFFGKGLARPKPFQNDIKPTVDKPVQLSTPVSLCQHMPCPPIHLPLLQFGSISAPPLGAPALVLILSLGYSFNLLSFIRYPCLHCILVMPSLQTECVPTSSNQRRRPCILLMCSIHPPGAGKAQRTGSNLQVLSYIARDALLLLVHPEWRKSRSTPQPFTLFRSRCQDAHCVVSTFIICFHGPVYPATGYGGIKKATVWREEKRR